VTLGWTLVEIPHTAMAAELSTGYHERSRIALWRQLLGFAGGVLFMASPMILVGGTTEFSPQVMRTLALFIMIGLPAFVALMCFTVPEPRGACARARCSRRTSGGRCATLGRCSISC
jgi:glycoside/pentoside/hexuronide:cation symporter, GPH family